VLQASEGLIIIIVLTFVFGIISRPPRSKKGRPTREPNVAWEIPTDQEANSIHDAAYSAASKATPDPYSPDQRIIAGRKT